MFYYRIYDDHEEMSFFKSAIDEKSVREHLAVFEKEHKQYFNSDFVAFLKTKDPQAESIEVHNITY